MTSLHMNVLDTLLTNIMCANVLRARFGTALNAECIIAVEVWYGSWSVFDHAGSRDVLPEGIDRLCPSICIMIQLCPHHTTCLAAQAIAIQLYFSQHEFHSVWQFCSGAVL